MKNWISFYFIYFFISFSLLSVAQNLNPPLNPPLYLSGNFGELRSNHFHSGIDIKTNQTINKPVFAVDSGYISRIVISPTGYGKALYINHKNGLTSVYAHLYKFANEIENYAYQKQMEQQSYKIDINVPDSLFIITRGEEIARSGNTGSSAGPHLHFELRDTQTEQVLDPISYYKEMLDDTRSPIIKSILLSTLPNSGIIEDNYTSKIYTALVKKDNIYRLEQPISAWGKLGFALKCYDQMNGTSNIYGVKNIRLFVDSCLVFNSILSEFSFDETRYINSFIDYKNFKGGKGFYQKCYVDPNNKLSFINSKNRGIIDINEERKYKLVFELEDDFNNCTKLYIDIIGVKKDIQSEPLKGENLFTWQTANRFRAKGIDLKIPKGAIYDSFCFEYSKKESEKSLSATHILHNENVPLHSFAEIAIHLNNDILSDKIKYGIEQQSAKGNKWIGGIYQKGWIIGKIREFGTYTIAMDTIAPRITPIKPPNQWRSSGIIEIRLSDNKSGIKSFKCYIDGTFELFEQNNRNIIRKKLTSLPRKGISHELRVEAIDKCGNISYYKEFFKW